MNVMFGIGYVLTPALLFGILGFWAYDVILGLVFALLITLIGFCYHSFYLYRLLNHLKTPTMILPKG